MSREQGSRTLQEGKVDGDGMTDPAQFTASGNTLWYIPSGGGNLTGVWMGGTPLSYVPAADFDGDGMTDPAGFESAAHWIWYLPSGGGGWQTIDLQAGTYTIVNQLPRRHCIHHNMVRGPWSNPGAACFHPHLCKRSPQEATRPT